MNACHPLDINLLAEAGVKHYLWKTEHKFKAEELDLSNTLSKELNCLCINPLKEPHRISRDWDELIPFMITGRHLDVGPLTAEQIEQEQGMPVGFDESSGQGKGGEPVTEQQGERSKRQQSFQQQTEGRDSIEHEAEYEVDEEGSVKGDRQSGNNWRLSVGIYVVRRIYHRDHHIRPDSVQDNCVRDG